MAFLWGILIWLLPPVFISLVLLDQYLHKPWLMAAAGAAGLLLLLTCWQSEPLWWSPLVLLVGTILCILEFIIPGFSFAGIAGILLQLVGLYLVTGGDLFLLRLVIIFLPAAAIPLLNRKLGSPTAIPDHMIHTTVNDTASGYIARTTHSHLVGCEGATLTALRPSGLAEIQGQRMDVICSVPYLPAGSPIRVRTVAPGRIEVEPIQ